MSFGKKCLSRMPPKGIREEPLYIYIYRGRGRPRASGRHPHIEHEASKRPVHGGRICRRVLVRTTGEGSSKRMWRSVFMGTCARTCTHMCVRTCAGPYIHASRSIRMHARRFVEGANVYVRTYDDASKHSYPARAPAMETVPTYANRSTCRPCATASQQGSRRGRFTSINTEHMCTYVHMYGPPNVHT